VTTTLLAVDDSKTLRKVLEITFAGEDYKTVLAENGGDALAKLRDEQPAVALVDAQLGGESGYDLCQQIKSEAPRVAVLILSSKQQPYDRSRGASVGADDFMDKPFDTQQLIDKVGALARKAGQATAPAAHAPAPVPVAAAPMQRPRAQTLSYGTPSPPAAAPVPPAPAAAPRAHTFTGTPAAASPSASRGSTQPIAPTPVTGVPVPAARPAEARPAVAPAAAQAVASATNGSGQFAEKLESLGLDKAQVQAVLALSREVVEKVVWEVVPVLAETLIKEEIRRLTNE
jgi:CheY-like chemotaxis protein